MGFGKRLAIFVTAAVLLVPAVGFAATYTVRTRWDAYDPKVRRIVKGDRITWRNPSGRRHDVRAYGGNWSYHVVLQPGEQATRRFRRRGVFRYRCTYHSGIADGVCNGMCGVIRVRRPS